jgi:hypothetical protein
MNIFIDTEFTNFGYAELISIALVADNNCQFYGELRPGFDFDPAGCSKFVNDVILKKLGRYPTCIYSIAELRVAVRNWLHQFCDEDVVICVEFYGDWDLLCHLLIEVPPRIQVRNVNHLIDNLKKEYWLRERFAGDDHHALHDAICNQLAFCCDIPGR